MQLQTLFILTFSNALFARGSPLPIPNANAQIAGHISYTAKLDVRSAEPMGGLKASRVAGVAEIAGNNDYTAEDAEFYIRSVEALGNH